MTTEFGFYRAGLVYINFKSGPESAYSMGMAAYPDKWWLPFQGVYPFLDESGAYFAKEARFIIIGGPLDPPFYSALCRFQRVWRRYGGTRRRCEERCAALKEELMAAAWAPRRVAAWLEAGVELEDL